MFSFAPPVKVARTQRLEGSREDSFRSSAGGNRSHPSVLEDSVVQSGAVSLTPSVFLSGAGTHMVWLVDENQKLLRLWNVASSSWSHTEPRMAQIPYFAAAEEGLPLFVSEMGEAEESLALCSERGAVSSLDHSVEFQLLDGDEAVTVSSFTCVRRNDCGNVIFTAIGTSSGCVAVDVKERGEHVTHKFDRLLYRGKPLSTSSSSSVGVRGQPQSPTGRSSTSSLWNSVRSFLKGGRGSSQGDEASVEDEEDSMHRYGTGAAIAPGVGGVRGADAYRSGGAEAVAVTHTLFRRNYPRELTAVNAASELMLLELGSDSGRGSGSSMELRWMTNVQSALGKPGYVVAVAETRHKVSVLFLTTPPAGAAVLPALVLASFSSSQGSLIHYVQVNTVADVVHAVGEVPRHHVKLHVHDSYSHAVVFVRHYCVRVNIQVGVRSPCLSADTGIVEGLGQPLCTMLRENGTAVTLSADGPVATWDGLWEQPPPAVLTVAADALHHGAIAGALMGGVDADADVDKRVADMLKAVQADAGRVTLDTAVLHTSEDIFLQRRAHRSNWTRADLNAEDENIVLHVTKDLRRRQQLHRRFLVAVLRHEAVVAQLQPETLAQVISAQEALLSQLALRGLQNTGVVSAAAQAGALSLSSLARVHRPFALPNIMNTSSNSCSHGGGPAETAVEDMKLLQTVEQVERCQQMLRRAIIQIAHCIREGHSSARTGRAGTGKEGEEGDAEDEAAAVARSSTAVELVFADPKYAVTLLQQVGDILTEKLRSVAVDSEEKFAFAYATGCMFVIVAQTIVESRENLKATYAMSTRVARQLWTASEAPGTGVQLAFAHVCTTLAGALADAVQVPALQQQLSRSANNNEDEDGETPVVGASASAFVGRVVDLVRQCDLLDVIGFLLHFSFSTSASGLSAGDGATGTQGGDPRVSTALKQTLLCAPLVVEPYGYPFGAPAAPSHSAELSRRALRMAEALALHFDGVEVLVAFSLSTPSEDPQTHQYARLQAYCQRNPRMLAFALEALWRERREWELLCLPAVLPDYSPTAATRDEFLECRAPHLLWLAAPARFDALAAEGSTAPPYIAYGPTQLAHRSRCLSLGKLAWIAAGGVADAKYDALALDAAIVGCQQRFLSPEADDAVLGLQNLVQRLIALENNVEAWAGAATVAAQANVSLSEDLLVQVLRRCKAHDGDALLRLHEESVSELETVRAMRLTAVGTMVSACAPLQDQAMLQRICETVLSAEEQRLVSSWLAALWTGENSL